MGVLDWIKIIAV